MDTNLKKVLITGSAGLVGSEAVKFFEEKGWKVYGMDSNMRSYFFGTPKKEVQFDVDIRDVVQVTELFKDVQFDAIIHTAAQPSHDWALKEPLTDFDVNARGTLILLEATRKYCPNAVFVHISTDKVYGEQMTPIQLVELSTRFHSDHPFNESLSIDYSMHSLFGVSKAAADLYVQEYGYRFGIKTVCFRPGCITGRNHEGAEQHGFLAYLAKCTREEQPYNVFGFQGKQVRDIIHAYDVVTACYEFIKNPKKHAVYNLGGGPERSISVIEAIDWLERNMKKRCIINFVDEPRIGDRIWDVHDVSKFRHDYPQWEYRYSLEDIINELSFTN